MSKVNKNEISYGDIIKVLDGIENQASKKKDTVRVMIRGLSIDGYKTIKGYNADIVTDDEYYRNSVSDTKKFLQFSQIQITIMKEEKL